jgi:hypothetical protein
MPVEIDRNLIGGQRAQASADWMIGRNVAWSGGRCCFNDNIASVFVNRNTMVDEGQTSSWGLAVVRPFWDDFPSNDSSGWVSD